MPKVSDHIALANRTHESIECLTKCGERHSPWIVTLAFYKAVHVVEAIFVSRGDGNSADHYDRLGKLRSNNSYKNIFTNFRPLYNASRVARYLEGSGSKASTFDLYAPPEVVLATFVHKHLRQVERSALKILSDKSTSLMSCEQIPKQFQ